MAGRRVPPKLTMDDSVLYLNSVKATFHDEPAKFKEFLKVLVDIKAYRINKVSGIAKMIELIKGHPKLLLGLKVFLPEASKELCQSQTIGSTRISPELLKVNVPANLVSVEEAFDDEPGKYVPDNNKRTLAESNDPDFMNKLRMLKLPTMDDAVSYLTTVKEALHDEPAKFKEFLKVLNDTKAHRMCKDSGITRMTELIKGHPKLLRGLNVFLPEAKITIPTKANKGLGQSQTIFCIKVSPELSKLNAPAYIASVKEAFHNEPEKYKEWINMLKDFRALRVDEASLIVKVEGLMKNHRNLLLGFSVYLSAGTKLTIPPEAEQHIAPSDNNKRKRVKCDDPAMIKITPDNNNRKRAKCDDPDYDPDSVKKPKRKRKGKNVSPPKKKVKLSKRTIHCKKCGQEGHNSRSCGKRALQACGSSGSQMKASQSQRSTHLED
ncbi:Paired amphipathic helix superfamily [Arabidopsis thaliana x Arabidopsis arenosa]|uniref:Paired amphipathic helix superfamily n=1 Tax=Arabidopsis thaliana x Arabidopsis arenosa TaxID=1240361 RepID=A0A8T2C4H6_9BRAS|nr:Paired amphipathic helix superfamily [Arabidopsis thaliana x Arabidopsis arenosa]